MTKDSSEEDQQSKKIFGFVSVDVAVNICTLIVVVTIAWSMTKSDLRDVTTRMVDFQNTVDNRITNLEKSQDSFLELKTRQAVMQHDLDGLRSVGEETRADVKKLLQRTPP